MTHGFALGGGETSDVSDHGFAHVVLDEGRRAFLGVSVEQILLPSAVWQRLELPSGKALAIRDVHPEGPAGVAGLRHGDLVVAFDGRAIESVADLHRQLDAHAIGRRAELQVIRQAALLTLSVEPAEFD